MRLLDGLRHPGSHGRLAFARALSWTELAEAHRRFARDYKAQPHFAHQRRGDGRSPPGRPSTREAVLRGSMRLLPQRMPETRSPTPFVNGGALILARFPQERGEHEDREPRRRDDAEGGPEAHHLREPPH